jgi:hypothetical protein
MVGISGDGRYTSKRDPTRVLKPWNDSDERRRRWEELEVRFRLSDTSLSRRGGGEVMIVVR